MCAVRRLRERVVVGLATAAVVALVLALTVTTYVLSQRLAQAAFPHRFADSFS